MLDIPILKALLTYCPHTGKLMRERTRIKGTRKYVGGPLVFSLRGQIHSMGRVCWALHYGFLPSQVRYRNGDPTDNRIDNLYAPGATELTHEGKYPGVSVIRDQRTGRHRGYQGSVYAGNPVRRHRTAVVETPEQARDLRTALKDWLEWVDSQKGTAQ